MLSLAVVVAQPEERLANRNQRNAPRSLVRLMKIDDSLHEKKKGKKHISRRS